MAKDLIHYQIKTALEKDGWNIIADPYILKLPDISFEIDLGAEKIITAQKENEKIVVEIKSFRSSSLISDIYNAYGQYELYREGLIVKNDESEIFLAISTITYKRISANRFLVKWLSRSNLKLLVVELKSQTIKQWIK